MAQCLRQESCTCAAAGPSTNPAAQFDQHMDGLKALANSIAGPLFEPPPQPHQVLVSPLKGNTAASAFLAQQRHQMLLVVGLATAEGKHAIAAELLTQVSRLPASPHASSADVFNVNAQPAMFVPAQVFCFLASLVMLVLCHIDCSHFWVRFLFGLRNAMLVLLRTAMVMQCGLHNAMLVLLRTAMVMQCANSNNTW